MKRSSIFAGIFTGMGIAHFVLPTPFESIVPPLPGPARFYNFASGAWEVATGVLLAREETRELGAKSGFALLLAVWPANMYHAWLERDGTPAQKLYHVVRQPLQVLALREVLKAGRD